MRHIEPILIVEDDPDVRESLMWLLEREGYAVEGAAQGEEALERLRRAPHGLVVLDLMMPVMDGFEFRVRQMQEAALASIPVIVCSCGGDLARKAEGLDVAACFVKPVDPDRLLAEVRRVEAGSGPDRRPPGGS